MNRFLWLVAGLLALVCVFLIVIGSQPVRATQEENVYWCHTEPNGNQQTLHLPLAALENAGHVSAEGNPLHAGDHEGECEEETDTPTLTPSPTPEEECDECEPTVTPTPTEEITPEPTVFVGSGVSDNRSDGQHQGPDGLGCAAHECKVLPEGTTKLGYTGGPEPK